MAKLAVCEQKFVKRTNQWGQEYQEYSAIMLQSSHCDWIYDVEFTQTDLEIIGSKENLKPKNYQLTHCYVIRLALWFNENVLVG